MLWIRRMAKDKIKDQSLSGTGKRQDQRQKMRATSIHIIQYCIILFYHPLEAYSVYELHELTKINTYFLGMPDPTFSFKLSAFFSLIRYPLSVKLLLIPKTFIRAPLACLCTMPHVLLV